MKQFEHKEGKKAELVPFMQYYPTYSSMDKQQKEWYFYWRSQVRKGIYLDTDLSYIFVHVYELLSGYGMNNADDGYKQLLELWKNYRKEYPKLDGYLFEWIFDFCQLYNLDFEMPGWTDLSLPYQPEIKNVIISKHSGEIPLKLTFALIDSLCDYSLVRSKFYNDGHTELPQRPENTTLEFWITENVSNLDLSKYQVAYKPGAWGYENKIILGSGYTSTLDSVGNEIKPEHYVIYEIAPYPNNATSGEYITAIEITDPSVYLYGLTVDCTADEFNQTFEQLGFIIENHDESDRKIERYAIKDGIVIVYSKHLSKTVFGIVPETTIRDMW